MRDRTETMTARVSASYLAVSRTENVHFKFADGSKDDEVSPTANGFFDAVAKFGPAPARVTRNAANDSIYKVEFHGKTYTLNSPGGEPRRGSHRGGAGTAGTRLRGPQQSRPARASRRYR